MERLTLLVGALAFLGSTAVVAYIAVTRTGEGATTALGAVIALVSAGAGFFLRGRVQSPGDGQITVTAAQPAQASVTTTTPHPPPLTPPASTAEEGARP